ncbi:autotransporter outer membrane beta-barrel domain-containing protein [Donghicola mangrovi]|uniref:Autotransporter outer membrane beta-barrel domain-containing protein n=1 Tax=Donghicola mangrovi TaxID=2729614 RepID=A0A850QHP6_9RHOB|nr:autotransporter outer membrane beta-barrel domain-containing protein [Donghicola mangrovi]NVO25559.1 autotransporter outer membrane beta-barrel domain-containing protein [Donghicola mangrovi]
MDLGSMLKAAALTGVVTLGASPVLAQEGGMPFMAKMARSFGPTGLIAEFGQNESYGSFQTRQAWARSEIAAAAADNVWTGYADSARKLNMPVTLSFSLPGNTMGVRFKGTYSNTQADENMTYANSSGPSGLVELMAMPSSDLMLGFGVMTGKTDVDIQHNDGSITASNWGVQFDLLKTLSEHWGLAGRAIYRHNESDTVIPLGFADLETEQGSDVFYTEWTMVGNYEQDSLSWVPEGWLFRPRVRAVYAKTRFESVTNSLGRTNEGTVGESDEYATVQAKVRLLQPVFRPGQTGFYVEGGYEREVINDLDLVVDDPNILHAKAGVSSMMKNGLFIDAGLGIEHGTKGKKDLKVLTVALSKTF